MNGSRIYPFLIGVIIASGLVLIVAIAIASGVLWTLIGGFAVVGVLCIGLAWIGVNLFSRYTAAVIKRNELQLQHDENMAKMGLFRPSSGYEPVRPMQIEAPKTTNPANQIQFNANDLQVSSVNLLLFSMNLLGNDSNRIASVSECAAANIIGFSARTWDMMIHKYLEPRYGVAAVPGPIQNGGGVYIPAEIGTVKRLHDMIVLGSAVDALPVREHANPTPPR